MGNSKNAKNYEDISWSTFVTRLQQKGEVYNCNVIKADRFFASSQICHICGYKNKKVQEKHLEEWICPNCGASHQRDVNASINLKNYVPLEQRKLTTVENDYVEHLAKVALQVDSFDEAVRCKVTNAEASTLKGGGSSHWIHIKASSLSTLSYILYIKVSLQWLLLKLKAGHLYSHIDKNLQPAHALFR